MAKSDDTIGAIKTGEANLVLAGGVESMSRAPMVIPNQETAFGRRAEIFEHLCRRAALGVAPADLDPHGHKHLRDGAHAAPADPDKVRVLQIN